MNDFIEGLIEIIVYNFFPSFRSVKMVHFYFAIETTNWCAVGAAHISHQEEGLLNRESVGDGILRLKFSCR